jgi:hypothetical protein
MREPVRREVVTLIVLVVGVDLLFIASYFLAGLPAASGAVKLGFTVLWTLATLGLVVRGLTRVRRARLAPPSARR